MAACGKNGLDELSKLILATVAHTLCEVQGKTPSLPQFEYTVGKIAAGSGADPQTVAACIDHIPKLILRVKLAKPKAGHARVSPPPKPQYRIRTEGVSEIIDSIDDYLREKGKKPENYLLWLDLDEKKHESIRSPGKTLGPKAIELLIYLVERLGRRVPAADILREVFGDEPRGDKLDEHERNKIQQQLKDLQKFCAGQFREHLFPDKFGKGLGLKRSFSDKYFIFARLC